MHKTSVLSASHHTCTMSCLFMYNITNDHLGLGGGGGKAGRPGGGLENWRDGLMNRLSLVCMSCNSGWRQSKREVCKIAMTK